MSIWQRIGRWLRSLFGSRDTDMRKLSTRLDNTYREQTQLLQQVRRGYADVDTSRKRVELQLNQLRQQQGDLEVQAKGAVSAGNDDEARAILGRKLTLEKAEAELAERHAALKAEQDKLSASIASIESSIEDFRVRKDTLNARHSAAAARAEINSATSGINSVTSDVGQAMDAAERRTRELESTADAVDELVAEGVIGKAGEDPRQAELRRFDAEAAEIEKKLDAMHQDGAIQQGDS